MKDYIVHNSDGVSVKAPLQSFTFKLSFWSRVKLFFGYNIKVAFWLPLIGTNIHVGEVVRGKGHTVTEGGHTYPYEQWKASSLVYQTDS